MKTIKIAGWAMLAGWLLVTSLQADVSDHFRMSGTLSSGGGRSSSSNFMLVGALELHEVNNLKLVLDFLGAMAVYYRVKRLFSVSGYEKSASEFEKFLINLKEMFNRYGGS